MLIDDIGRGQSIIVWHICGIKLVDKRDVGIRRESSHQSQKVLLVGVQEGHVHRITPIVRMERHSLTCSLGSVRKHVSLSLTVKSSRVEVARL